VRLEVTRKTDLALRALLVLGRQAARAKAAALAASIGSTVGFVPQVVAPLVQRGWVRSDPGPTGGYVLSADLAQVSVLDVIEAVEGPTVSGRCVLVDGPCSDADPCALHVPWSRARDQLLAELAAAPVSSLDLPRPRPSSGGRGATAQSAKADSPSSRR
jgi:Rrf2 family iron-sulfur cluster assembly transcriptional regulator